MKAIRILGETVFLALGTASAVHAHHPHLHQDFSFSYAIGALLCFLVVAILRDAERR